jgi:hypothetical protein
MLAAYKHTIITDKTQSVSYKNDCLDDGRGQDGGIKSSKSIQNGVFLITIILKIGLNAKGLWNC